VTRTKTRLATTAVASAVLLALTPSAPAAPPKKKLFGGVVADVPTGSVPTRSHTNRGPTARIANLPYGGGPVMHSNRTHVIFWQPKGSSLTYEPGYQAQVETFLSKVAADSHKPTNVYGLSGQYHDDRGPAAYSSTYGGAVLATDRLPPDGCSEPPMTGPGWDVCMSDAQLEAELRHVVAVDHLRTSTRDVYFLVLPAGLGTCETSGPDNCALGGRGSGFCGYHSTTPDQDILYAVIPYNAVSGHCQSGNPRPNSSTADPTLSTLSHEHNETVTDPLGDAWIDPAGNENGDLCIQSYGPQLGGSGGGAWNQVIHGGHYYLQDEWSNVHGSCQPRDAPDTVSFSAKATATARITARHATTFTGRANDPHGSIAAYDWFFGDGGHAHRRIARHTFRRPGTYRVVLRITDSSGNWGFAARALTVAPAPARDRRRR
jgi:hypothetical protein